MKTLERLSTITRLNKVNTKYVNKDLYRLLYKEELYILAYEKIKSKSCNSSLDGYSVDIIRKIIEGMKNFSFCFKPAKRIYIPKANKKGLRPIDMGDVKDKIVLEAIRMILESVYENSFLETSHGFRPNRGCHTALRDIRVVFKGSKWFIEGDIKNFFNSVDHNVLISLLKKRIEDPQFLNLIRKVLNAGYFEFKMHKTDLIGVPQGNIISPILSNIYLHELDLFVEEIKSEFVKEIKKRKYSRDYTGLQNEISKARRNRDFDQLKRLRKRLLKTIPFDYSDSTFKRLNYVRYADDWLIGIIGSRKDALAIKEKIKVFLKERLNLELNEEKTYVTSASKDKALFLGTLLSCPVYKEEKLVKREKNGIILKQRKSSANIRMTLPLAKVLTRLKEANFCNSAKSSRPKFQWLHYSHKEILLSYNAVINGISNYYSFIDNCGALALIYHLLRSSAAKLLATKFNLKTQRKVYKKFGKTLKSPEKTHLVLKNDWSRKPMAFNIKAKTDLSILYTNRLTRSILTRICAICSSQEKVEMHHVKHLKNLNVKLSPQEKSMVSLNRKQIPVCRVCHMDLHTGKYDGMSLRDLISSISN